VSPEFPLCPRNSRRVPGIPGELGGLWRWRIGDYRVVARIEDERITFLVVRVVHRRGVYR
jgi:mRNA interferase RelE/StbE